MVNSLYARVGAIVAALALAGSAGAATLYLKADATGTGDGSSWTDAYTSFEAAVAGLQAAGDGSELRVAGGRCKISDTATTLTIANFTIRGGYRAASDDDETRDPSVYQSTLWWRDMSSMMSANWTHVRFHGDTLSGYTTESTSTRVCEDDGTINDPPAFEDDYDGYIFGTGGTGGKTVLNVGSGGSGTIEGLNFLGFRAACIYFNGSNGVTVKKCRFVGSNAVPIWDISAAQDYVVDCDFVGGFSSSATAMSIHRNNIWVENCRFIGNYKNGSYGGGVLHFEQTITGLVFTNCLFTHNAGYSSSEANNAQPGLIAGGYSSLTPVFADCVMTNNASYSLEGSGVPLIGISTVLKRCHVLHNAHYVKSFAGRAYSLIGAVYSTYSKVNLDGCVIESNRVESAKLGSNEGVYYVGIVGPTAAPGCGVSCVNTVFRDNVATGLEEKGAYCVRCRGVISMGFYSLPGYESRDRAAESAIGVANCLFTGADEDGVYDLMECGFNHEFSRNGVTYYRTVVNSVFQRDGDAPYNPFRVELPSLWVVRNCSLKNWSDSLCPVGLVVTNGLETDEVPFARRAGTMFDEPTVKTPGLRSTANLAVNSADGYVFAWSNATTGAWVPLCNNFGSTLISGVGDTLMADAAGAARTADAFTRGPIQPLKGVAETGCSLTVRRLPRSGGTLSSPSTQAVAKGDPITSVTATPASGLAFAAWQNEDGSTYSESNPLAIAALNDDLVLTAVFSGEVNLTFNLGSDGTFAGGGATYVTNVAVGAAFPTLPAIVPAAGKVLAGWSPSLPDVVPGAATTYTAVFASGGIHVVPSDDPILETSSRDGLTWVNATGNIQDAIDRAAEFGGEVWVKTGVYTNAVPYVPRSNVTIIGGFVGGETSADEADPVQHPTILTGDLTGNNYWLANGSTSAGKIWDETTLNYPNADGADWYWKISGDSSDCPSGFNQASSTPVIENFVLRNLTLTGYRYYAWHMCSGSLMFASNVTFVANNHFNNVDTCQASVYAQGGAVLSDCKFIGNFRAFTVSGTVSGYGNLLANCLFDANYQHGGRDGGGAQFAAAATITNCVFRRHYTGHVNSPGAVMGTKTTHFYNCDFIDNRAQGDGRAAVSWLNYGSFNRCRVIGNVASCSTASAAARATCLCLAGGDFFVNDCYFADNRMVGRYTGTGEQCAGAICCVSDGRLQFYNSTFVDSVVAVTNASTGKIDAGSFTSASQNGNATWALVHCTVARTKFDSVNESTGDLRLGECVNSSVSWRDAKGSSCGVANSILWNAADGYVPFYPGSDVWMPVIAYNVIRNFDSETYEAAVNTAYYEVVEGNVTTDPVLAAAARAAPLSTPPYVEQLPLSSSSPCAYAMPRISHTTGTPLYYVYSTKDAKWHKVLQKSNVASMSRKNTLDAWGLSRASHALVAPGALQVRRALRVIVR